METSKMKNMIILKNLPSNIIEEAIVVLKPNKKILNAAEHINNNYNESKPYKEDYIIKEAQMVISNYISEIKENKKEKEIKFKNMENKYKKSKKANIVLVVLLAIMAIVA